MAHLISLYGILPPSSPVSKRCSAALSFDISDTIRPEFDLVQNVAMQ